MNRRSRPETLNIILDPYTTDLTADIGKKDSSWLFIFTSTNSNSSNNNNNSSSSSKTPNKEFLQNYFRHSPEIKLDSRVYAAMLSYDVLLMFEVYRKAPGMEVIAKEVMFTQASLKYYFLY